MRCLEEPISRYLAVPGPGAGSRFLQELEVHPVPLN